MPSARNKWLQAGYKQVTSRLQAGYRGALWTHSKRCKPSPAIWEPVIPRADSRTKCVGTRQLVQSIFQANFKSMPKRAHLDFHILGLSGDCSGTKGFSEYMWAAGGLSVPCPALGAQHPTIPEVQIAACIPLLWLLEELAPPGGRGWWQTLQSGTLSSALEPGTDRAHEVPPSLVPTPHPKKQNNFYLIMNNRICINHVKQRLFSGTELVFNSAVNKDFQLWGKNL